MKFPTVKTPCFQPASYTIAMIKNPKDSIDLAMPYDALDIKIIYCYIKRISRRRKLTVFHFKTHCFSLQKAIYKSKKSLFYNRLHATRRKKSVTDGKV